MNAGNIHQLCATIPPPEENVLPDNFSRNPGVDNLLGISDPTIGRFVRSYGDLRFVWNYARTMAANRLELPSLANIAGGWLWKAYLYSRNPQAYGDPSVKGALAYMWNERAKERAVLNALLMSKDADIGMIAQTMNQPVSVINAYEQLFFNVFSRRADHNFIASIVYPNGRAVEFFDNYVRNETLDMLLMRAGFNNGMADVLYWAGFPSDLAVQSEGKEVPVRLEAMIMANGYMLARSGWLNQGPSASPGMHAARQLLTAAKAGGTDEQGSPFLERNGARTLLADLQRHKSRVLARRESIARGNIAPDGMS